MIIFIYELSKNDNVYHPVSICEYDEKGDFVPVSKTFKQVCDEITKNYQFNTRVTLETCFNFDFRLSDVGGDDNVFEVLHNSVPVSGLVVIVYP